MSTMDVDGLNAGYAQSLLEEYLENPEGVPSEWRALFESGDRELLAALPGLARLLETLREAVPALRQVYCGTSAYELEHISDHEERVWLRQAIESGRYRTALSADEKKLLLARLTDVEGMERYLRRAFLGQKQFSIEGL